MIKNSTNKLFLKMLWTWIWKKKQLSIWNVVLYLLLLLFGHKYLDSAPPPPIICETLQEASHMSYMKILIGISFCIQLLICKRYLFVY